MFGRRLPSLALRAQGVGGGVRTGVDAAAPGLLSPGRRPRSRRPAMSPDAAVELGREALLCGLLLALPVLGAAMLIGLVVSLAQAVTQLQDQTLSFVPKILATAAVTLYALPWMITTACEYAAEAFRTAGPQL